MMDTNPNWLYSSLLLIAGIASLALMILAWQRRERVSCARLVALYSATNMIWSLTYALHWTPMPRPNEFFWVDMTYLGVAFIAVTFLAFALCYAGRHDYLTKRNFAILSIIPLLTLFFLATDPWLGIFFAGKRESGASVIYDGGIGFWIFTLYSYSLVLLSGGIILQAIFRFPKKYHGQVGMIFLGIFIPVLVNALTFLGFSPFEELDLTPITFSLTGIFFAIAIFRYNFLDLMPVSRDAVFETHRDAIFVLDLQRKVVDANQYARHIFWKESGRNLIGRSLTELRQYFPSLPLLRLEGEEERFEFSLSTYAHITLEMRVSPLRSEKRKLMGYICHAARY